MPKSAVTPIVALVSRRTKRTKGAVIEELAQIRAQGYAVSHGERLLGLSAISAPVKDSNDEVHYCLTVGGPTVRMQANEKEFIKLVVKAAAGISKQFGGKVS
jgi:DNA-binding IclR family transcriptional regulator